MGRFSHHLEPEDPRGWDVDDPRADTDEELLFGRYTRLITFTGAVAVGIWFWVTVYYALRFIGFF